jgi:cation diffusion facilitator family transporter
MHTTNLARWKHDHQFCGGFATAEKNTRRVLMLTAVMMIVEIAGGLKLHSMALFADGWHMATHVTAFFITVSVYAFARRHAKDVAFSFGTGKIAVLGAFTSAIVLGAIAMFMAGESILRFFNPLPIHFNEAIAVACLGLAVNVVSALLLKDHHHDHHHRHHHHHGDHPHEHKHHHHHGGHSHGQDQDLNLKSAYIHVLADAVTSILAITALVGGKFMGWVWLDPVMGLVGSAVITQWAYSLVRDTNVILLDRCPNDSDLVVEIRKAIEDDHDAIITDLHIWQVAVNKFAAIISLVAHNPKSPEAYKELLKEHEELVHVTVEVHRCEEELEPSTA